MAPHTGVPAGAVRGVDRRCRPRGWRRGIRADRADPLERAHDRRGQAVHAARNRRAGSLYPGGLRRLPLADDSPDARRDGSLRRVFKGRRVRLRPPVFVGLQTDGTGPAPGWWKVSTVVALRPYEAAGSDLARIHHAWLSVAL